MTHYEETFLDIVVDLSTSEALFRQSCEELLGSLSLPDKQFRDLVDDQLGWDNKDLEDQFRERLGKDYTAYKLKVKVLGKKIRLLKSKLRLEDDYSVRKAPHLSWTFPLSTPAGSVHEEWRNG